jgi:hypothetical protein
MRISTRRSPQYRALLALALLAAMVGSAAGRTGKLLIITAPDYNGSGPLSQLVSAKTTQGLTVSQYVVPVGTTNTALRTYIQGLWGAGDRPDYILLVGDTDGSSSTTSTVPHFTGGGSKHAPTDLPYACMDAGDDWYPEFAIGRFSVRTVAQLQAVVDKTLTVEGGVFSHPEYIHRVAFLATDDSSAQAEQTHDWVIDNYLDPAGYESLRIYAAQGGNTQQVTDAVNGGVLFVNYFGHSSSSGWWAPSFTQTNVNALSNSGLYGLAFGFSCNTANFAASECCGETWIRVANKGSAAYISASNYIYYGGDQWDSSRHLEKDFWAAFFVDYIWEVGPAWRAGLYRFLIEPEFDLDVKRNLFEMFVLLGDPSLLLPHTPLGPDPTARVRAPNGGETWTVGEAYDILWTARDDVGVTAVDLYLSTDGGTTFPDTIATGLTNTGTYHWVVPARSSLQCRIKIVAHDADAHTGADTSDADFTLTPFGPRVIYDFPLSANPGWTTEPLWAFGQPTGGGGEYGCNDPNSGHTGANVYGYNLNGDYENSLVEKHLTTTTLDCTGITAVKLAFWRWLGVETSTFDHAYVRVSNNGTTWTTVWENSAQIADGAWLYQELDLSSVADNKSAVYVRWTMGTTDSSWRFCGWNIDDVQIIGIPAQLLGDLNCDGVVDFDDINPLVLALSDPLVYQQAYPNCDVLNGDCNGDGFVDFDDINPFVVLLSGGD